MISPIHINDLEWEKHPVLKELLIKKLLTFEKNQVDLSVVLVKVKKGSEIPAHVHEQDDITYHIEGRGKMWVEGSGDFEMKPGSLLRIPAGVKHQPHDIETDLLVFDIFLPHLY
jgi:quercetin dioxygenase-like cupin family protein